jgi:hypothetical protein
MTMRLSLLAASAVLALATVSAYAAPAAATKTLTPQQQRMADCSHQSKGKKGADHKAFMSACLKGKSTASANTAAAAPAAAAPASAKQTQREKMKTCNAEAKTKALKGADRKSFMSTCLKGA